MPFCIERPNRFVGCSVLLYPVMPESSNADVDSVLVCRVRRRRSNPAELKWGELEEGTPSRRSEACFHGSIRRRLWRKSTRRRVGVAHATEADAVPARLSDQTKPAPPMTHATEADAVGVTSFIEIDDFAKVDLRVGQVLSAERVPKADKLLVAQNRSR